uniref:Uncharacterized protein n=1 Tax=Romanomermis culicivorax TaxID=13658 RepID=A0A915JM35_ROMCU
MAFMTKFISSEFFRETTIDGFSNISRTKSVRACTFWFAVTCLASLVAVYQITDEVTAKFVDASKLIFRPAWPGEAFYPQIKFCYEHWSQWVMINNETRTIDPMVLNVLCNIQMRNKVLMDACAMLNITDVHAHIHTYSDSFLNLGKLYERFFDRNFEDDSNDTTHQPGKLYFDELKGQMCIVLEPIAGKWVTNPKMGQTLVMHVPFVYTNTLRKPIREIIENDHVLKKPGMVYLDDKPVFPLWHMSNAVQTVTLMSTTVVYLKNIRPSYKCQRDGQITEYKNTVSSSYLVEDCEDICQDNTHGV